MSDAKVDKMIEAAGKLLGPGAAGGFQTAKELQLSVRVFPLARRGVVRGPAAAVRGAVAVVAAAAAALAVLAHVLPALPSRRRAQAERQRRRGHVCQVARVGDHGRVPPTRSPTWHPSAGYALTLLPPRHPPAAQGQRQHHERRGNDRQRTERRLPHALPDRDLRRVEVRTRRARTAVRARRKKHAAARTLYPALDAHLSCVRHLTRARSN